MSERLLKFLLGVLSLALFAAIGVGAFIYTQDAGHWTLNPQPRATPTASPTPSASTVAVMSVPVPANSSCKDCHVQGSISVPNVPVMAHPLQGWANCSSCHGETKLVKTAPGHRGIHRDACLLCHQQPAATTVIALPRPHHMYPGKSCTDCHKPGGTGPLPSSMVGRKNCWICHMSAKNQDLFSETSTTS